MAVLYTPHFIQFFDDDGAPLAGGKLYAYEAGTTTPKDTYTTAAGSIANANPVILDAAGRATVFLSGSYKFVLKSSADVEIETTDNISAFASSISGGVSNITADYTDTAVAPGDSFVYSDASDSGNTKRDTIQGIMDLYILDEDAMTSNSATQVPSQQSVKAYVDNSITTSIATQSDQETATSTTTSVSPGRQHFHPSAAKFWADVSHSGATPTLSASYNVTSITDEGTGDLTITIATDFSSANWACVVSIEGATPTSAAEPSSAVITLKAAGSVRIGFFLDNQTSWTAADPQDGWHAVGFGDI